MKQIHIFLYISLFLLFVLPIDALATVGGPTTIDRLAYNQNQNAVYYTVRFEGGRGCPPVVYKISLEGGRVDSVLNCDQAESLYNLQNSTDQERYYKAIDNIMFEGVPLKKINLINHGIKAEVGHINEVFLDDSEWKLNSNFHVKILQGNKIKSEFDAKGCEDDQPFVFRGYAIPGVMDKILIMQSTIGDCFEGGYVVDNLFVINNIKLENNTDPDEYLSNRGPFVSKGDFVAYSSKEEQISKYYILLVPVITFILGVIVSRRRKE